LAYQVVVLCGVEYLIVCFEEGSVFQALALLFGL
jgi:hypothetical protein